MHSMSSRAQVGPSGRGSAFSRSSGIGGRPCSAFDGCGAAPDQQLATSVHYTICNPPPSSSFPEKAGVTPPTRDGRDGRLDSTAYLPPFPNPFFFALTLTLCLCLLLILLCRLNCALSCAREHTSKQAHTQTYGRSHIYTHSNTYILTRTYCMVRTVRSTCLRVSAVTSSSGAVTRHVSLCLTF